MLTSPGFNALATKHKDETHDHGTERRVVDKGETVQEKVHQCVMPVVLLASDTRSHVHKSARPAVDRD